MQSTTVYLKMPKGYVGFVEELPGANTQGDTLEEARTNLQEFAGSCSVSSGSQPTTNQRNNRRAGRYSGANATYRLMKRLDLIWHFEK